MKTQSLNLFIVDDNLSTVKELKDYLLHRFGEGIRILTFNNSKSCLEKVDENTNIVVLNSHIQGENNADVLKSIKESNPETEVILLSEKNDIASAIDMYRSGARGLVIKGRGLGKKTGDLVVRIFTAPIRIIERELGLSERIAIFIMSFLTIAVIVVLYFIFINRILVA
jgi:response regulator RpfG family c-di-GMP phosphodiesterase